MGSGRAADMLAYAYKNTEEEEIASVDSKGKSMIEKIPRIPDDIKKKLKAKVEAEWPNKDADELTQTIIHCVMRRHLIVIFSLDDKNTMKDIDIAILHAIMKEVL
ncbi:hypothetical protein EB796_009705 [Bugula neritina]|uniref:Uncharacterized protein n=1 Tax=Bugula neritina TaxID=10212 RepID=A0A7J7K1B4_BUGNE|nr:hypothetical protein EB796_009705 [Bugula neritina]